MKVNISKNTIWEIEEYTEELKENGIEWDINKQVLEVIGWTSSYPITD